MLALIPLIPLLLHPLCLPLLCTPLTAASPPPLTPLTPGRQTYNLTCPTLPPTLRRGDPASCIDVIFRQLNTLQPPSGHGFLFTTNPAHAPRPGYVVPFTFPHEIPGGVAMAHDNTTAAGNDSEGAVVATSRRSTGTGTSSQCFIRFDFWDREDGGPGYQHEEGWGMNLVSKYAGAAWDGCLRGGPIGEGGVGRVVPRPKSEILRLVIEVLAVEMDG